MSSTDDIGLGVAPTCEQISVDERILRSQGLYIFGIMMAIAAIAIGLDSLRTTPSRLIRNLLALALIMNLVICILNWVAWIYPFNCMWEMYRNFDYFWTVLSTGQCYVLALLSLYRAQTVLGLTKKLMHLVPAALLALVPAALSAASELSYLVQIVDTDSLLNAVYYDWLSSLRYAFSYTIEAGSLLCIVGKILFVTYKQHTQQLSRTIWMVVSVFLRLCTVIVFYRLGALSAGILNIIAYSVADSILLIMIAIDEVRFKNFFADPAKPPMITTVPSARPGTTLPGTNNPGTTNPGVSTDPVIIRGDRLS